MKCRTIRTLATEKRPEFPDGVMPQGTEIDHPDAYMLVRMGVAVPADAECEQAHGCTPERLADAQRVYPRTEAGIQPEDFHLWDAGVIVGYNPDGSYKPGANWVNPEPDDDEEGGLILPSDFIQ